MVHHTPKWDRREGSIGPYGALQGPIGPWPYNLFSGGCLEQKHVHRMSAAWGQTKGQTKCFMYPTQRHLFPSKRKKNELRRLDIQITGPNTSSSISCLWTFENKKKKHNLGGPFIGPLKRALKKLGWAVNTKCSISDPQVRQKVKHR